MHELSIVMNVLDIAKKEAQKHDSGKVEAIELEIGTIAGIEFEAFNFAWETAIKDPLFSDTKLIINKIKARAKCVSCGHEFEAESVFEQCQKCGEIFTEILRGKELRVKYLTLE